MHLWTIQERLICMGYAETIKIDTNKIYAALNEVWQFIKNNKELQKDTNQLYKLRKVVSDKMNEAEQNDYLTPTLFDLAYAIMVDSVEGINDNYIAKEN